MVGAHDVTVTSFNWQTSWLGGYYLPANSPLIDAGTGTADQWGLYHFTTQTNQLKETNSPVDIGFHYVAVDTNGIPFDANSDGIPDYLADANGNGAVDTGEVPWNLPVTGLKMWLKADVGVTFANSNDISLWADQSGNGNHATQPLANYEHERPLYFTNVINGLPAIWFNGTNAGNNNSFFQLTNTLLTGATGAETFVVLKTVSDLPADRQSVWGMGGAPLAGKAFPDTDGSVRDDFGSSTLQSFSQPAAPLSQFNIYQVTSQSGNWSAWLNGMVQFQTNVNTVQFSGSSIWGLFSAYTLGASTYYNGAAAVPNYFMGEIAEVLVYNRGLSDGERQTLNDYLKGKYGLVPVVAITGPTNGSVFPTGANINITASASEPGGGTIKQVEFFQGTTSLGIVTNSPYSLIWSNVAAGGTARSNYSLTTQATGVNGLMATSSIVNLAVDPPPTVLITNPVSNAYCGIGPVNIAINVTVTDFMGINQVQYFYGTTSIGVAASPPYGITWNGAPSGTYVLSAIAVATDGLTATNSVTNIIVDTDSNGDGLGDLLEPLYGTNPNATNPFTIWIGTPTGNNNLP
jgi:hypothetical protein